MKVVARLGAALLICAYALVPASRAQSIDYKYAFCEAAPWASTRAAACGIAAETLPMCDRPGVTHYNIHSQLNGTTCYVSWQFTDPGQTAIRNWSANAPFWSRTNPPVPESASADGMCKGDPILPASAENVQTETDLAETGPTALGFSRIYRSAWGTDQARSTAVLGRAWTHNHSTYLRLSPTTNPLAISLFSAEGYLRSFTSSGGVWIASDSADTLTQTAGGWTYHKLDDDVTLNFDTKGRLTAQTTRNGWATSYTYNPLGQLASIANPFGDTLTLAYNPAGQLTTVTSTDGRVVTYGYDAQGRLSQVTYPDGKTRGYVYENTTFPNSLTGVIDEAGARFATIAYDTSGRAISAEHAGSVERYQVSYPVAGSANVTDPLGTLRTYSYGSAIGKLAVTSGSLPSEDGSRDATSRIQGANGLVTSETDFKGVRTDYVWDATRRLPTSVTRAANTQDATTVTTQWHASYALPALITESGRTTSFTYDGAGNVLSKVVTDTNASPNTTRTWSWTYDARQLVATQTEPNGAVTSYEHDNRGKLTKSTNALGHVTQYDYDSADRVVSTTAPNGLVTTFTYDQRDRLLTRTVGGQLTTTLTYNPTGTLATLSLPNGLVLSYTYDTAQRMTGWSNNRGEQGTFTLNGMGERTAEQIRASSGAIAWSTARTINNINRLYSKTDGPNQTNVFGYDANGERTSETNGINQSTTYGRDNLRRVISITNAANATANLTWNALDALTQAKDFKGVATNYGRDADGNATGESSPDVGARSTQYDALGLSGTIVDALGQATHITRDALGRPTQLSFADGKVTTLTYDTAAVGKGYLASFTDRSGTTSYQRDGFGRVTIKTQTLINGSSLQVGYGYTVGGQLGAIAYPNGGVLQYGYDLTGRLVQISWNGQPVVSSIAWNPMGQPVSWTWSFASPASNASRTYDTAGRLTATEFSGYVYNAAGRIISVTQALYKPADSDPTHDTITSANATWTASYDLAGRITGFGVNGASPADTASFTYDANGNRASSSRSIASVTTARTYALSGNVSGGFAQTIGSTSTSVSYSYNANGDLLSDGLTNYSYNAEGRLSDATTGASDSSPTTRYAYNALGQRVFKTEPVYPPAGDASDPGFFQTMVNFFDQLWSPAATPADALGYAFSYDEEGTLIAETGMGGANSGGSAQYIQLPTANGPMPIVAILSGTMYAVHSDHLNTPRQLSDASGQPAWQWAYSAFGDEKPTTAAGRFAGPGTVPTSGTTTAVPVTFNLRYPGQYADAESGLNYNYFRSYSPSTGRYTQGDPIGMSGGWNRFGYVGGNALSFGDPSGLIKICSVLGGCVDTSPPPLLHPDNPYSTRGTPSIQLPSITFTGTPGLIASGCKALADWMFSESSRPPGVPEDWVESPSRDGKGTKWTDPSNPKGGDYVRVRGDGTVTQVKNGRALDVNGDPAPGLSSPEAHFPRDQWLFRP